MCPQFTSNSELLWYDFFLLCRKTLLQFSNVTINIVWNQNCAYRFTSDASNFSLSIQCLSLEHSFSLNNVCFQPNILNHLPIHLYTKGDNFSLHLQGLRSPQYWLKWGWWANCYPRVPVFLTVKSSVWMCVNTIRTFRQILRPRVLRKQPKLTCVGLPSPVSAKVDSSIIICSMVGI